MRKTLMITVAASMFAVAAPVFAVPIAGTVSPSEVKASCDFNHGTNEGNKQTGEYGCIYGDHDVWCKKNGKCELTQLPTRTKHHHHPVKVGTVKPPYAGNKTTIGKSHPVTIMHTEEHHSNQGHNK